MTNKQIIIDGVQFNKWGDFLIDYELNGIYKTISSSDKCYKILKSLIEQLKSKEQECETLTSQLDFEVQKKECLEQECEELKAQLNDMACMDDDNVLCYPRQELKKEYNEYISTHRYSNEEFQQERKTVADLAFWSNKYKRGLEKIEKELKEDLYCESQECGCDDFEECFKCTKEHILDIINKANFGKSKRSETRPGESCVELVEPPIIQEAKGEGDE
jgi:hypothetical protein|uniref:Uncharacterized protein n=1 Tax=Myoviridae sp. ctsip2 TaxID=2826705 RepID=A0A8S5N5H9_9CAUD|nr:MAG TPA: hypothetical protein [Myoviridae sp. ctsip2]